jgi:hypothetical protein
MPCLVSFVHVSSSYAYVEFPAGSTVEEKVYPLMFGNKEVHQHSVMDEKIIRLQI